MRSSFWRGQTTVVVGEDGTKFLGSSDPASSRKRANAAPRQRQPSPKEIAAQEAHDREEESRAIRSFVSMCVASWLKGNLTKGNPKAPKGLAVQVASAGGNLKWISASKERRTLFHQTVCQQMGRAVPYANLWGRARTTKS